MSVHTWRDGNMLHPVDLWVHPTTRRIPVLFITPRAKEVVLKVFIKGDYFVFEETDLSTEAALKDKKGKPLEKYKNTYLLPKEVKGKDLIEYCKQSPIYIYAEAVYGKFYYLLKV